jgi:tRNA1(Val) A37 N6-methylase TrmN6
LLLADFVRLKKNDRFLEIGAGSGCLSFIIIDKQPEFKEALLVEVQNRVFQVLKENVERNNLLDKILVVNGDSKSLPSLFPKKGNTFDVVITNPPYIKLGGGRISPNKEKSISNTEISLSLEDIARVSSFFLKIRGRLYIIHRSERLKELLSTLSDFGLESKRLCFVYTKQKKPSKRVLLEAYKGGRPGLKIEPPIFLE